LNLPVGCTHKEKHEWFRGEGERQRGRARERERDTMGSIQTALAIIRCVGVGNALKLSNPQVCPGIIPKVDIAIGCMESHYEEIPCSIVYKLEHWDVRSNLHLD
jgi:hypothetical protein